MYPMFCILQLFKVICMYYANLCKYISLVCTVVQLVLRH